ncbi:MAG: hypothetical protein CMK07_06080 [Ponticaulis sp.]|nr:hypothetical protein [Ponticaulis sp.]
MIGMIGLAQTVRRMNDAFIRVLRTGNSSCPDLPFYRLSKHHGFDRIGHFFALDDAIMIVRMIELSGMN